MENLSIFKETFVDRLEAFMIAESLNANSLSVVAGLSHGLVNKALKNRSSMNSDSVEKILCAYTTLSAEWLMTGRGSMYVKKTSDDKKRTFDSSSNDSLSFYLRDRVRELESEVRRILKENASLQTKLELLCDSGVKTG